MNIKLIAFISMLMVPYAGASSFFAFPVIDLDTAQAQLLTTNKKSSVVMFFEPNCSWCFKQSKVFNRYLQQCTDEIKFFGLGVNGSRQQIKQEAWRWKAGFPLYMASPDLLDAMAAITATPFTLILDAEGSIVAHLKGYVAFEKWRDIMRQYSPPKSACLA